MSTVFAVLQEMGMTPNFSKSAFLIASHGWQAQQHLSRTKVKHPDDGGWAIPVCNATALVPIKTQHVLGSSPVLQVSGAAHVGPATAMCKDGLCQALDHRSQP